MTKKLAPRINRFQTKSESSYSWDHGVQAFGNYLDLPEKNREKRKRASDNWKSKPKKEKGKDQRFNICVNKEHFGKKR